jgi:hypothetical protein
MVGRSVKGTAYLIWPALVALAGTMFAAGFMTAATPLAVIGFVLLLSGIAR